MSFYKNYPNRKDWRKEGKASTGCMPHGGCPYCFSMRMYQQNKEKAKVLERLKDYDKDIVYDSIDLKS
jgi:hypothetical protein